MRFNHSEPANWLQIATTRLKFGSHCVICASPGMPDIDFCDHCESLLDRCLHISERARWSELCVSCGAEIDRRRAVRNNNACIDVEYKPSAIEPALKCFECRQLPDLFSCVISPYRYQFPLEHMIKDLKYRNRRQMGRVLGELLARSVVRFANRLQVDSFPDFIIPVPMHPGREAARGFNHAADIARWCAKDLQISVQSSAVARIFDTGSLAGLNRAERQYRVLGAFRADQCVAGKRIAIVDDVLTTGSTSRELARELYDTGVESVELWVLARTSRER